MRIIAGQYKNRRINMPFHIRPTQDKVRKALFDILGDIQDLRFLELFAGSGAVGLEALSRGAADLTLVEHNRGALKVIDKNIESLKLKSCQVYALQADKAIKKFHRDKRKFDVVFLDPPYYKTASTASRPESTTKGASGSLAKKTLQILGAYDILAPNGLIITQHFKKESLPEAEGDLILFRQSRYGDTILSFYKKG